MKRRRLGARLTKICATIGPATSSPAAIASLLAAGMDIARLNFSHGDVADHGDVVKRIRRAAAAAGRNVGIMMDLQGPRIRIGALPEPVELVARSKVFLRPGGALPQGKRVSRALELPVTYARLQRDVHAGHRVLLKDGRILLRVLQSRAQGVLCAVERGGRLSSGAGINFPDSLLDVPALTPRDLKHIAAGVKMGVDAVALSFVRDASDMIRARNILRQAGSSAMVVAKIERTAALANLDAILEASDGVIVARGDLGVECPVESVPLLQKEIIRSAIRSRCFVITATQMLETMITSETPTRAEVSDVANAVLDGSDAVMLSAETAIGKHPSQAVAMMDRIARAVEAASTVDVEPTRPPDSPPDDFIPAIAQSAVALGVQSSAAALVPFTFSGRAATSLASLRPAIPIHAFTPSDAINRRLAFYRGVLSRTLHRPTNRDEMFKRGIDQLVAEGVAKHGQVLVLIGGYAMAHGAANTVKVYRVGAKQRGR